MATGTEVEAHELKLYIDNDGELYRRQGLPIIKNLTAKKARGTYNHDKASKLYKYYADNGAREYGRTHLGSEKEGLRIFSPQVRRLVAKEYADEFDREYNTGSYDSYIPKKYQHPTGVQRMERTP